MRVYLPATLPMLADARKAGEFSAPRTAFAVTPSVREWYVEGDEEELEYVAFTEAARASIRFIDNDPTASRRRVVISVDVADTEVTVRSDLDRAVVQLTAPVPVAKLAAVHVDSAEAEEDVRAAANAVIEADLGHEDSQFVVDGAEGHDLEWYDVSEIDQILDS